MSTTYEKCPPGVAEMAAEVIATHDRHLPLTDCGLRVAYIFAYNLNDEGEPAGPALKLHGVTCAAIARKIGSKDRVLMPDSDAVIYIDFQEWQGFNDKQRLALLDHELYHFQPIIKDGAFVLDEHKRPKLRIREHDVDIGWFRDVALSHGAFSMERGQAHELMHRDGHVFFPEFQKQ